MEYDAFRVYKNLTTLIEEHDIKIGELEKQLEVSPGYISRTFKEGSKPGVEFLIKVADFFKIGLDSLLFRDFSLQTEDEKKKYEFLHKLVKDTWDSKLNWELETRKLLNERVYIYGSGPSCSHPLFEAVELNDGEDREEHPAFISRSFDSNTVIADDCYHLQMKTGSTLYLMSVCETPDEFGFNSDEPVIEVWMVLQNGTKHFLCDSNAKNFVGQSAKELYAVIKRAANCPKSSEEVDAEIEAFMNALPFEL